MDDGDFMVRPNKEHERRAPIFTYVCVALNLLPTNHCSISLLCFVLVPVRASPVPRKKENRHPKGGMGGRVSCEGRF